MFDPVREPGDDLVRREIGVFYLHGHDIARAASEFEKARINLGPDAHEDSFETTQCTCSRIPGTHTLFISTVMLTPAN